MDREKITLQEYLLTGFGGILFLINHESGSIGKENTKLAEVIVARKFIRYCMWCENCNKAAQIAEYCKPERPESSDDKFVKDLETHDAWV